MYMTLEDYTEDRLWPILVETVHTLIMYPHHKAYTKQVILHEKNDIKANYLALRLRIALGEALVILHELENNR